MTDQPSLAQRVSASFFQLSTVASDLNAVSDELGKSIAQIDTALKNLNLGVSVWVKVHEWDPGESEDYEHWSEHIGYAKIAGKWGISLKRVEGTHRYPEREREESWLFNDAPRKLRLQAIDKIPELLEQLSSQACLAIGNIREKLADVQAVAAAVNQPKTATRPSFMSGLVPKAAKDLPQPRGISEALNQTHRPEELARGLEEGARMGKLAQSLIESREKTVQQAQELPKTVTTTPAMNVAPEVKK